MLGSRILLRTAAGRFTHQECIIFRFQQRICSKRSSLINLHQQISTSAVFQDSRPKPVWTQSSVSLLKPPKVVTDKAADLYLVSEFNKWAEACEGIPVIEIEETLDSLVKKLCGVREPYRDAKTYITVLNKVLDTRDSGFTRQYMIELMHHHKFACLGAILIYAQENNVPWLQKAVHERISVVISSITRGHELVNAFAYIKRGFIDKEQTLLIEARTKYLCEDDKLSTKNIIKILHLLGAMRYRSMDLIGALVFSLHKKPSLVDDTQLALLFFAAAKLKITSPRMLSSLEILSSPVLGNPEFVRLVNVHNMIIALGKLKWQNPTLLSAMCSCIKAPTTISHGQFRDVLLSCSMIGALPDKIKSAVIAVLKNVSRDGNPQVLLDIVWSLLVFNIKSESVFKHVLSDAVVASLTIISETLPKFTVSSNFSKLLNIANSAKIEYNMEIPDCLKSGENQGPVMSLSWFHNTLGEMLVECLNCDMAYIERSQWFPTGHIIDFRYLYDTQTDQVVSPLGYIKPCDLDTTDKKQPESHMKWVAVLANDYRYMTIGQWSGSIPEARRRLAASQLQQMGYCVITVTERYFMADPDRERKVEWLKQKLSMGLVKNGEQVEGKEQTKQNNESSL